MKSRPILWLYAVLSLVVLLGLALMAIVPARSERPLKVERVETTTTTTTVPSTTTTTPPPIEPLSPADGRDAPDPAIISDGEHWAAFSTQVWFLNLPVSLSTDLRTWSPSTDALPILPPWAEGGRTWAPGVQRIGDQFVLYFAARHSATGLQAIGVATSDTIEGPYDPAADVLAFQPEIGGSIDPQPFVDDDGTIYLLWKSDTNAVGRISQIYAQQLRPDGLALVGDPVVLLTHDAPWERPLIENPMLVKVDGTYVLLYSGGMWDSAGYATGYATSATVLGPYAKQTTEGPVFASTATEAGPGGASVFATPDGEQWIAYHAWTPGAVGYDNGGARSLHFARLADWITP